MPTSVEKTELLPSGDVVIVVMGPTGSGKTTFIDYASRRSGEKLARSSRKSQVQPYKTKIGEQKVILVDTPGFDDTNMSDTQVLEMIADWLQKTYNNKVKLSGIIYMHRISDNRMAGTPFKNFKMFAQLCGSEAAEGVILTTTMWGKLASRSIGEKREKEMTEKFWKDMLEKTAKVARFEASYDSAWQVIGLVSATAKAEKLLLQEEMVDLRKRLSETGAGKTLWDTLQKQLDEEKKLLNELCIEAEMQDNPKLAADLRAQYERVHQQLEATFEQIKTLKIPFGRRLSLFFRSTSVEKTQSLLCDDVVIAVIGPTGVGKGTFISYASRQPMGGKLVGHGLKVKTLNVQPYKIKIGERKVILVDTPGFDTNMTEIKVLNLIAEWLQKTYNDSVKLAGIIYMHRISDNRTRGDPSKNLKMFAQLCGSVAAERVILTTTMWGKLTSRSVGEKREKEMTDKFWKDMIEKKAQVVRFEASYESAWQVIGLASATVKTEKLLLQEEMVDLKKKLSETGAGRTLWDTLQKQLDEEKKLLNELCIEAETQDNPQLAADLRAQYEQVRQQLKAAFKQAQTLKIPLGHRVDQFFEFKKARSIPIKLPF
ncbi:hypothetical protein ONZ45_g7118 [Pleurotus djamor]|nr:hypothetical protein ONZ45_g7118 [Pleurotus djamor]